MCTCYILKKNKTINTITFTILKHKNIFGFLFSCCQYLDSIYLLKPGQQIPSLFFIPCSIANIKWIHEVAALTHPVFSLCFILGYGHTVPLSDGGKAFCIIYSVIGIPFTLLFLTAVVQRIIVYVTRRPVLYFHIRWGFSKQIVAIIHAVVLGFITVSCFFFIPAAIFSVLEDDWNFLESFYFCFISLSTIGLGDYVPGEGYNQKFRELYKIGITCKCSS